MFITPAGVAGSIRIAELDSSALKAFMATVQSGSITRAATRLGIAQPSLSQKLLRLEDELGIKLFGRTVRGVTLTDGGRVFMEHASNILRDIERAKDDLRDLNGNVTGKVSIGLPVSMSLLFGVPLILAVKAVLPDVNLVVEEAMHGHVRGWLERNTVDLAVLYNATQVRHLSVKRLAMEDLCIVGRPGDFGPADGRGLAFAPVSLADIEDLRLIIPSRQNGMGQSVDPYLDASHRTDAVRIEVDSLLHIKALVAAGHGYTFLSHASIAQELSEGALSAAILAPRLRRSIDLARNASDIITRASVRVEDVLIGILHSMMADGTWLASAPELEPKE